jgi:hypothetical protein
VACVSDTVPSASCRADTERDSATHSGRRRLPFAVIRLPAMAERSRRMRTVAHREWKDITIHTHTHRERERESIHSSSQYLPWRKSGAYRAQTPIRQANARATGRPDAACKRTFSRCPCTRVSAHRSRRTARNVLGGDFNVLPGDHLNDSIENLRASAGRRGCVCVCGRACFSANACARSG